MSRTSIPSRMVHRYYDIACARQILAKLYTPASSRLAEAASALRVFQ